MRIYLHSPVVVGSRLVGPGRPPRCRDINGAHSNNETTIISTYILSTPNISGVARKLASTGQNFAYAKAVSLASACVRMSTSKICERKINSHLSYVSSLSLCERKMSRTVNTDTACARCRNTQLCVRKIVSSCQEIRMPIT